MLEKLDYLFKILAEKGVKINISKSKFKQEVNFGGLIISEEGCRPDPTNIEAIVAQKKKNT